MSAEQGDEMVIRKMVLAVNRARRLLAVLALLGLTPLLAAGCGDTVTNALPETDPGEFLRSPSEMSVIYGDSQSGPAGGSLPGPLMVRLLDRDGIPVPGVEVSWSAADQGGTVSPEEGVTDGEGVARAVWRLGSIPGEQRLEARAKGVTPLSFVARATSAAEGGGSGDGTDEILPPGAGDDTGGQTGADADDPGGVGQSSLYPNEPRGFTRLAERTFSPAERGGPLTSAIDPLLSTTSDFAAPRSAPSVGRMRYPAGLVGGTGPGTIESALLESVGARRVYVTFWVKVSENWQGHPINDKVIYLWTHGKPVVYPVYVGGDDNPLSTQVVIQDDPGGGVRFHANRAQVEIHRGRWHRWELVLVNNSGDRRDGEIHWWIDGTKVGEYRDVLFSSAAQAKEWEMVAWAPIWGGSGGVVREEMYMWMDHLYASGAR